MGEHDAPSRWLEHWRQAEPLRLYLWSVAGAVLAGGVSTGLVTREWALAVGGVLAAALMFGGTALARRRVSPALTVARLLDSQHASSYRLGVQAGMAAADPQQPVRRRCGYVQSARRCTLSEHPETVGHELEEEGVRE